MLRTTCWFKEYICHISTKPLKVMIFFFLNFIFNHVFNSLTQTMTQWAGWWDTRHPSAQQQVTESRDRRMTDLAHWPDNEPGQQSAVASKPRPPHGSNPPHLCASASPQPASLESRRAETMARGPTHLQQAVLLLLLLPPWLLLLAGTSADLPLCKEVSRKFWRWTAASI